VKRILFPVLLFSLCALGIFATGCGDDDGPVDPGTVNNEMSAKIDGQQWSADQSAITVTGNAATPRQGTISISGTRITPQQNITLLLSFITGPGTYPLGVSVVSNAGGTGLVTNPPNTWLTPLSGAAGTVTISTRTDSRIAGTFAFVANEIPSGGTTAVTEGQFDITVSGGLPNLPTGFASAASAKLNGANWNAAAILADSPNAGEFNFVGTTTDFSIALHSLVPVLAGSPYGVPSQIDLTITRIGSSEVWHAESGPDVAFVTLIEFTDDLLVGTFQGTIPQSSGGSTPMVITEGQLNLSLQPIEIKGRP